MFQPYRWALILTVVACAASPLRADGPADNVADRVRPVPPEGVEVPAAERQQLGAGLAELQKAIDGLAGRKDARTRDLLPDVRVYYKAVHDALKYNEFFNKGEFARARSLLDEGLQRAKQLAAGQAPWASATGLVVRGYVSKIDGSVQPYGLVVPDSYTEQTAGRYRLDLWFHGRGETLSELNFIEGRLHSRGQFTPADTIVLHPYGRYCNANKFAGEVDVLEAIDSVKSRYRIDDNRICERGFSMGGASAWQFAVHYSDRWCAANPGAGFAETPEFLKFFQKETLRPTWYEKKLWHMYDSVDYAVNLTQCPTVAYSGEIDVQKQAADIMAATLAKEGITLTHIIGPKTKHSYHPDAAIEVERRMDEIAAKGRNPLPRSVQLVTYTLKYNRMFWVTIDAMSEEWEKASVKADFDAPGSTVQATTGNVTALTLDMPSGRAPFAIQSPVKVTIDRQTITCPAPESDRSWHVQLHREGDAWKLGPAPGDGLHKRHDLQGPIDDAFMDSFIFVRPTGKCAQPAVQKWVDAEFAHAVEQWRSQFRGEARVKDDTAVTDADIAGANLVLWGDPSANAVLKRIADKLPIKWESNAIVAGDKRYAADHHALILIYPNPMNPDRYVVLNSGFTYREYDYLNNARQVPKLPDWAVIDLTTPPGARWPGKVVDANFFDEAWRVK
jgi:dienelactone hydrolase